MAALTTGRITPQQMTGVSKNRVVMGVKANATLQLGSIIMADASNRAISGAAVTGSVGVGVLQEQPGSLPGQPVVGSATDRGVQIQVTPGIFAFDQDASILATTQYGTALYAVDDHTVTLTSTGASQIGYLAQAPTTSTDPQIGAQVWVAIGMGASPQ